jgi:nucleotide-binding universal stress UspA family protein
MIIRDILVHLDSTPRAAVRLELAVQLAMRTEGYVIGLYTGRRPDDSCYDELPDIPTTEGDFHAWLQQQGIEGEWRLAGSSAAEALTSHGRCADLIVVGQHDPDSRRDDLPERALIEIIGRVGRPVLAVPYTGSFSKVGTRILVAWDGRPESTRAIHEALPLLSSSGAVRVLVYNPRRQPEVAVRAREAVRLHLSRHGIPADVAPLPDAWGVELGEVLLSSAADFSADLMVAGVAIPRARDLIFRTARGVLIKRMIVPLLLST